MKSHIQDFCSTEGRDDYTLYRTEAPLPRPPLSPGPSHTLPWPLAPGRSHKLPSPSTPLLSNIPPPTPSLATPRATSRDTSRSRPTLAARCPLPASCHLPHTAPLLAHLAACLPHLHRLPLAGRLASSAACCLPPPPQPCCRPLALPSLPAPIAVHPPAVNGPAFGACVVAAYRIPNLELPLVLSLRCREIAGSHSPCHPCC